MKEDQPKSFFRTKIFIALVFIVLIVGIAFAAVLTHNFPAIGSPGTISLASTCPTLTLASPGSPIPMGAFVAIWNCGSGITALTSPSSGGQAIPIFTLPTNLASLSIIPHGATVGASCSATTGVLSLTSGTPVTFPAVGSSWDYCGQVTTAPVAGFAVNWT